jgi:hypothetical protein
MDRKLDEEDEAVVGGISDIGPIVRRYLTLRRFGGR